MKTAICYFSRHKGNTLKILNAMAEGQDVDLIDVTTRAAVDLSGYDLIGLASGIYAGSFSPAVADFARQYLPDGKDVFLVYTSASGMGGTGKPLKNVLEEKHARVADTFHCQGMTTFGPFGLVKGFPKGLPGEADCRNAKKFFAELTAGR